MCCRSSTISLKYDLYSTNNKFKTTRRSQTDIMNADMTGRDRGRDRGLGHDPQPEMDHRFAQGHHLVDRDTIEGTVTGTTNHATQETVLMALPSQVGIIQERTGELERIWPLMQK